MSWAYEVEVVYTVNGTTKTDTFRCNEVTATLTGQQSQHGTYVGLTDGIDERGRRVVWKLYRNAETVAKFAASVPGHGEEATS